MIVFIWVLTTLTMPLAWCQIDNCRFGGEECICFSGAIICWDRMVGQRDLPIEFLQLRLDVTYTIMYYNKNIPRIEQNSSLSRPGLKLDSLDLSSNSIEIIEQGAFESVMIGKLNLKENRLKNLESLTNSLCELKELNLQKNQIEYLEEEWFECKNSLSILDIRVNGLISIESGVFCNLPTLRVLSLDDNKPLVTIEEGAFCNGSILELRLNEKSLKNLDFLAGSLCQLSELNLNDNNIEYLKKKWFECKEKLQSLSINSNRLTLINSSVFSDLTGLSKLSLCDNQIQSIESFAFSNLNTLVALNLSGNRIKEIKSYSFNNLTSLESITGLNKQFIQTIHPYAFVGLSRLHQLNLEENALTSLSNQAFIGLDNLSELNLRDNYLLTIEFGVFDHVSGLKLLYLTGSFLTNINKGYFSTLKRVTNLTLDQNRIEMIEPYSYIGQSESLKSLNLSYNKLLGVKKSHFSSLRVLSVLDLSNNQISSIEEGSFENTISLIELRLDHNCIFTLHKELFKYLSRLQSLSMSNNVLIELDPLVFRHNLSQLNSLNLSFNQIDSLPDLIFNNLTKLSTLDVSNNRLQSLNRSQIFQGLASLKYLDMSNNYIEWISIQSIQSTLVSLGLGVNRLDNLELFKDSDFTSLSAIDLSSNLKLNNATQLLLSLERCQSCQFELQLRNMSTRFIKDLIDYLSQFPPLVYKIAALDLSYNDLSRLFDLIPFSSMSSSLTRLYLKNTNINSSVSFLQKLTKLKVLDLSDNQVVLSHEYFENQPFTALYLSNTGLKDIQKELVLYSLKEMADLDLSRNLIEILRANTGFEKVNNNLNLSYNRILIIENNYMPFYGRCLDLSHNLLTSIKVQQSKNVDLFLDHNNLKYYINLVNNSANVLNLDKNHIDYINFPSVSLSMSMNNLTSIKRLDTSCMFKELSLTSNQIAEIQDHSFFFCKDLKKLDLSNNLINSISNSTFAGLLSLKYLNLSSNLIEFIHQGVFDQSKLLTTLDLNNNKIKTIMDKSFSILIYLEKLYLNSLEMETVSDLTFDGLKAIKFMKLNSIQFDSLQNIEIIKRLSKNFKSKNERFTWYPSTNIEFNVTAIDGRYCSMVLLFARNNILLNLLEDLDQNKFFSFCRSLTLTDLKYSKFSFQ